MKLDKANESVMNWVERMMKEEGFSDEDIKPCTLDGFDKMTHSKRIMKMVRLAYYRSWKRGIKTSEEAHMPIVLR